MSGISAYVNRYVLAAAMLGIGLASTDARGQGQESYVIGLTGDLSGSAAGTYKPLAEGVRIYFDQINSKGGINGHPVQLVIRDSRGDPNRVVADLNYFVDKKALAVVFTSPSGTIGAYAQQSARSKMPTLYVNSCYPPATPPSPNKEFFCPGISTLADSLTAVDLMFELMGDEKIRLAFVTTDIPGARGAAEKIMKPYAEKRGAEVVDVAVMPLATSDATAIARSFAYRDVNAVISYTISNHMLAGADALAQLGWKGKYLLMVGLPGVFGQMEKLKVENVYGFDHFSLLSEGKPVHQKIKNAIQQFAFGSHPADARWGYRSAIVLGVALEKCGWPCERGSLLEIMNDLTVDSQDMLDLNGGPVVWTETNHTSLRKSYRVYHWDSTKGEVATAVDWFEAKEREWK